MQNMDEDLNNFKCFTSQYKNLATKKKCDEKQGTANIELDCWVYV